MINPQIGATIAVINELKGYVEPIDYALNKDYWKLAEWVANQAVIVPAKTIGALEVGAAGCTTGLYGCVVGANLGWSAGGIVGEAIVGASSELGEQIGSAI